MVTMTRFVDAFKKGKNMESACLPFAPMSKVISENPKMVIGISGVRHIHRSGCLAVWPVVYVSKEQVKS